MKTAKKVWITVAICLIVLGAGVSMCSLAKLDFNFESLATQKAISNEHKITDDFSNIKIDVDTSDIEFVYSQTDECMVVFVENEKTKHNVTVNNNTLVIDVEDNRKWYDHIGISFSEMSVTVHLPKEKYVSLNIETNTSDITIPKDFTFDSIDIKNSTGDVSCNASTANDLKIKTSTGHINVDNITASNMNLTTSTGGINVKSADCSGKIETKVSTGKTNLTNVKCESLISNGNTGDIKLTDVIAAKDFNIKRSTGDIRFDECDAGEILITTDTGDVGVTLLTDKVFICKTDTGDIDVPKTTTGGTCEITTDTGDVRIKIGK